MKVYPDRIVHAALFRNGNLSCPQSKSMFEKNGINGWPILLLDNIARIANGNLQVTLEGILASYRDIESRKSLSYVQIQTELSGRSVKVDLHGYFKKAGDYKVQVMLLEDGIFDNGETFNDIVRVVMTSETGDPFTIQEDHSERTFTYNATVPQGYDLSKMHVLVFIQAPVFDTTFMVDNAFTAPIPTP